jgi:hypothetical protein
MPESRDESAEQSVQLPWESMDDGDAPSADEASPDAELEALALAAAAVAGNADLDADDGAVTMLDYAEAEPAGEEDGRFDAVDYEHPVPAEPLEDDLGPPPRGGGWTVAALCVGIGLVACCVIIPQADANRRLVYERERLKVDLDSIRKQVSTNDEFLHRVADDPNLAERLAQRQMRIIREGTRVLELKKTKGAKASAGGPATPDDVSPFHLVAIAPPPPMPPYEPQGGLLAGLCYDPHRRLYLMGVGLFLMAAGLVCGFAPGRGV